MERADAKLGVLWNKFVISTSAPQRCGGSSLPSRQEMIALQNSYSGKHSPDRQGKVLAGHLLDLRKSQFSSSIKFIQKMYEVRDKNFNITFAVGTLNFPIAKSSFRDTFCTSMAFKRLLRALRCGVTISRRRKCALFIRSVLKRVNEVMTVTVENLLTYTAVGPTIAHKEPADANSRRPAL